MKVRSYTSPAAFKQALENRLRDKDGLSERKRQLIVFDRLLARVVAVFGDAVILKGGLVLELRLKSARTTKDVDLRVEGSSSEILTRLQEAGRRPMNDFMTFEIGLSRDPEIQNDGTKYEGIRFRAECKLGGKTFGWPFGIDVAFGDPVVGQPDVIVGDAALAFAGIEPPTLRVYPVETHIAEKLHAYTMPRLTPNSRVKDLPDLPLLAVKRSQELVLLRH